MEGVNSLRFLPAMLLLLTVAMSGDSSVACPETNIRPVERQCLIQKKHRIHKASQLHNVKIHQHNDGTGQKRRIPMAQSDNVLLKTLPAPILALGWKLFQNENTFFSVVQNSVLVNITHAGVNMTVRINSADDAVSRLSAEGNLFSYDLDTMGDMRESGRDMLNMLDIGGNYGVVTIAAFKKYPQSLRVITVEPIPTTYFFLKWNLFLNGIPEIKPQELTTTWPPGVLALNRGIAATDRDDLHLLFDPKSSMNARVSDCNIGDEHCTIVPSITIDRLARMFRTESIAMVKMDCEGCEFQALPALAERKISKRVKRLAGELHLPDEKLEALACQWDHGRRMTKCAYIEENNIACEIQLGCPE